MRARLELEMYLDRIKDNFFEFKVRTLGALGYGEYSWLLTTLSMIEDVNSKVYEIFKLQSGGKYIIHNKFEIFLRRFYVKKAKRFINKMKSNEAQAYEMAIDSVIGFSQISFEGMTQKDKDFMSFYDKLTIEQSKNNSLYSESTSRLMKDSLVIDDFILYGIMPSEAIRFLRKNRKNPNITILGIFLIHCLHVDD